MVFWLSPLFSKSSFRFLPLNVGMSQAAPVPTSPPLTSGGQNFHAAKSPPGEMGPREVLKSQAFGGKWWNFNLPSLAEACGCKLSSHQPSLFPSVLSVRPCSFGFSLGSSVLCQALFSCVPRAREELTALLTVTGGDPLSQQVWHGISGTSRKGAKGPCAAPDSCRRGFLLE